MFPPYDLRLFFLITIRAIFDTKFCLICIFNFFEDDLQSNYYQIKFHISLIKFFVLSCIHSDKFCVNIPSISWDMWLFTKRVSWCQNFFAMSSPIHCYHNLLNYASGLMAVILCMYMDLYVICCWRNIGLGRRSLDDTNVKQKTPNFGVKNCPLRYSAAKEILITDPSNQKYFQKHGYGLWSCWKGYSCSPYFDFLVANFKFWPNVLSDTLI